MRCSRSVCSSGWSSSSSWRRRRSRSSASAASGSSARMMARAYPAQPPSQLVRPPPQDRRADAQARQHQAASRQQDPQPDHHYLRDRSTITGSCHLRARAETRCAHVQPAAPAPGAGAKRSAIAGVWRGNTGPDPVLPRLLRVAAGAVTPVGIANGASGTRGGGRYREAPRLDAGRENGVVERMVVRCQARNTGSGPASPGHPLSSFQRPKRFVIGTRRSRPNALGCSLMPGGAWRRLYSARSTSRATRSASSSVAMPRLRSPRATGRPRRRPRASGRAPRRAAATGRRAGRRAARRSAAAR